MCVSMRDDVGARSGVPCPDEQTREGVDEAVLYADGVAGLSLSLSPEGEGALDRDVPVVSVGARAEDVDIRARAEDVGVVDRTGAELEVGSAVYRLLAHEEN